MEVDCPNNPTQSTAPKPQHLCRLGQVKMYVLNIILVEHEKTSLGKLHMIQYYDSAIVPFSATANEVVLTQCQNTNTHDITSCQNKGFVVHLRRGFYSSQESPYRFRTDPHQLAHCSHTVALSPKF